MYGELISSFWLLLGKSGDGSRFVDSYVEGVQDLGRE